MTWKHLLAGIIGFTFGFWFCMPRQTQLLPRYEVLVTDSEGQGIAAAPVIQRRQDFAVTGLTTTIATADTYGRAAFPAIAARTSPLLRAILCTRLMAQNGIHTPCGYSHQITVDFPNRTESNRTYDPLPLKARGGLIHITMNPPRP